MTVEYVNRYNDKIYFTDNGDGTVTMDGGKYIRYGVDDDGSGMTMVDPSGGPMVSLGTNLKMFFEDGVDRKVESMKIVERDGQYPSVLDEPVTVLFKLK